ncbi:MAG: chromatin assembly factor-I (CAF-I) p90 subunit [Bogoriella megaspora]|nr:MAG: chromatin assembly factor-I (CAF-I) p90 subunit [Bogoriella megaspora]
MSVEASSNLATPQKRTFSEDVNDAVDFTTPQKSTDISQPPASSATSALTELSSHASTPPTGSSAQRQASPAPSTSTSVSVEANAQVTGGSTQDGAPPTKRRKLTPQEKEQKQTEKEQKRLEKEAKDKERAEQKAKREEEKRIKDEERRAKNEEKEAKTREKDLEKQRKEEERLKKERSQLRLSSFFSKPKTSPNKDVASLSLAKNSPRQIVECLGSPGLEGGAKSQLESPQKQVLSDYHRTFLPFQLPQFTTMAPMLPDVQDPAKRKEVVSRLGELLKDTQENDVDMEPLSLKEVFVFDNSRPAGTRDSTDMPFSSVREKIAKLQGTISNPIDLDIRRTVAPDYNPTDLLQDISMKHIQFHEDVRPPYCGTWSKITNRHVLLRTARNPLHRVRDDTDYDYDSEAEWEEAEDGDEDLASEEDDADSVDGPESMDGFLDDENDEAAKAKRKLITGNQEPISTGLCWEDEHGKLTREGKDEHSAALSEYRMGFLIDTPGTIDPFSTTYWVPPPPYHSPSSSMQPPATRPPLATIPQPSTNLPSTMQHAPAAKTSKPVPKRLLAGPDFAAFKEVVQGSQLVKRDLLQKLKERFPKETLAVLRDTLNGHAARVGVVEGEKRWIVGDL